MGLTNLDRALGRSSLLLISRKLSTLSDTPPFSANSFRLAFLLALLDGLNLSFLVGVLAWFFKITKAVVPFDYAQGSVLVPVLFSLFINDLPASLSSFVSCSLYADDLAISSFSLSVPTAVKTTQVVLIRLERWSKH